MQHHTCLLSDKCFARAVEAAEFPARRMAAGTSFRSQPTPSDVRRSRDTNFSRNSVATVERSADSPRDVHNPRNMHRQSLPAMRVMSRSRSRDRGNSSSSLSREQEQAAGVSP